MYYNYLQTDSISKLKNINPINLFFTQLEIFKIKNQKSQFLQIQINDHNYFNHKNP
jgi:hypothetical protein